MIDFTCRKKENKGIMSRIQILLPSQNICTDKRRNYHQYYWQYIWTENETDPSTGALRAEKSQPG
jgi:hypothetical protein